MTDYSNKALLPAGMGDGLPPDAAFEAETQQRLMDALAAYGYDRVKPPLLEFEDSLLTDNGSGLGAQTFRLMDPVSRRMMGLRPDMTLQVARIATTRLKGAERPLRLAYAGEVLRVMGTQLRPERQFAQVGAEIIGSNSAAADAEVILMAVEALQRLGLERLSVDLGLPTLVPAICRGFNIDATLENRLRQALDGKDAAEVARLCKDLDDTTQTVITGLLGAIGSAESVLQTLNGLKLPTEAAEKRDQLAAIVTSIKAGAPDITITIDPIDDRGFEYHCGMTFTLFALGVRGELGSGGRYIANGSDNAAEEPATGLTIFMDTVLRAMTDRKIPEKLFLPAGTPTANAKGLRQDGWITITGLRPSPDTKSEAKRLNCTHILGASGPEKI